MKNHTETIDPTSYDRTVIAFSGGKDSMACLLHAIKSGCKNIELWHHEIDGREGSTLMDWPVTPDYCRAVAEAFDIPIYFSWLTGGFEREMTRQNQKKAATQYETPEGLMVAGGIRGKEATRMMFPQVSGDLSVRWCSAYLKIDVMSIAIKNQDRFNHSRTLVISGERAEESPQRAKYQTFEPDRTDNRTGAAGRHVDRWRPIHGWSEAEVWAIIEKASVNPHPAYKLGWARLSCLSCIFGSANQWATIREIAPDRFNKIADYEEKFGKTIQRKKSVRELADQGSVYEATDDPETLRLAFSETYTDQIIIDSWELPAGAFGESAGPS